MKLYCATFLCVLSNIIMMFAHSPQLPFIHSFIIHVPETRGTIWLKWVVLLWLSPSKTWACGWKFVWWLWRVNEGKWKGQTVKLYHGRKQGGIFHPTPYNGNPTMEAREIWVRATCEFKNMYCAVDCEKRIPFSSINSSSASPESWHGGLPFMTSANFWDFGASSSCPYATHPTD